MSQIFPRTANYIARLVVIAVFFGGAMLTWFCLMYARSSYGTNAGIALEQPIPFSHQHHVGVLGIDCRYCHTTVEHSSYAGMPPTKTCMNCHGQIWVGSAMLEGVRNSYRNNAPLRWDRVYNLPGFVYFDHSIHVQKGIGCASCHGQIDEMPFTYQVPSLLMQWCLNCHRHPEEQIRPRDEVFNLRYQAPADQEELGRKLCEQYKIKPAEQLTSCSVCHR